MPVQIFAFSSFSCMRARQSETVRVDGKLFIRFHLTDNAIFRKRIHVDRALVLYNQAVYVVMMVTQSTKTDIERQSMLMVTMSLKNIF